MSNDTTTDLSPWEGTRRVVDPAGNIYTGTWVEDSSSTHGVQFLRLVDNSGKSATGFGGLTPAEAAEYGITL